MTKRGEIGDFLRQSSRHEKLMQQFSAWFFHRSDFSAPHPFQIAVFISVIFLCLPLPLCFSPMSERRTCFQFTFSGGTIALEKKERSTARVQVFVFIYFPLSDHTNWSKWSRKIKLIDVEAMVNGKKFHSIGFSIAFASSLLGHINLGGFEGNLQ